MLGGSPTRCPLRLADRFPIPPPFEASVFPFPRGRRLTKPETSGEPGSPGSSRNPRGPGVARRKIRAHANFAEEGEGGAGRDGVRTPPDFLEPQDMPL